MAQLLRMLPLQSGKPEFRYQHSHKKLSVLDRVLKRPTKDKGQIDTK